MNWTTIIDVLAYSSGLFFSVCLIPQLQLMWQNRSASDVSISWTLLFLVGLVFQITYLALMGGYIWFSVVPELSLALGVLWSKFYLDNLNEKQYMELKSDPKEETSPRTDNRIHFSYDKIYPTEDLSEQIKSIVESQLGEYRYSVVLKHATLPNRHHTFSLVYILEIGGHIIAHYDGNNHLSIDIMSMLVSNNLFKLSSEIERSIAQTFNGSNRISNSYQDQYA